MENLKILDFDTWIMGIVSKMYVIFNGDVLNSNESDSLGLASRVDQGPSKVFVATFTGPT